VIDNKKEARELKKLTLTTAEAVLRLIFGHPEASSENKAASRIEKMTAAKI
jgi:hypothetical protein